MSRTFADLERAAYIEGRPEQIVLALIADQENDLEALDDQRNALAEQVEELKEQLDERVRELTEAKAQIATLEKQIHDSGVDLI